MLLRPGDLVLCSGYTSACLGSLEDCEHSANELTERVGHGNEMGQMERFLGEEVRGQKGDGAGKGRGKALCFWTESSDGQYTLEGKVRDFEPSYAYSSIQRIDDCCMRRNRGPAAIRAMVYKYKEEGRTPR